MILYIVSIVFAHEGLHGVGFRYIGKASWENINYGVYKYLMPYCICKDLIMSKRQYIGIMLLPNIVLSGLTLVIMFKSYNLFWTLIAAFVISSGIGDYFMVAEVSKYTIGARFQDHPMKPGFYVYE